MADGDAKPAVYPRVDDEATIVVTWPEAVGIIQASWNWPFDRKDLEVYGRTGQALTVRRESVRFRLESKAEEEVRSPAIDAPEDDPVRYLVAVARGQVRPSGLSSLENNLIVTEILDAARESARTGRTVSVPGRHRGGAMSGRALCGLGLALLVHGAASAQVPEGEEFRVNTYTTGRQWRPAVAAAGDGSFVVVWDSFAYDGNGTSVLAQRYDGSGLPRGAEFRIDMPEAGSDPVNEPTSVSSTLDGRFVVVWFDGRGGIFARRYDKTGVPLGPDFPVNTAEGFSRRNPTVGSAGDGGFVVVWEDSFGPDGEAILGRRFDASGNPLGAEFQANTVTGAGTPESPDVAVAPDGRFVVTWSNDTHDYSGQDVFARRYDSSGNPLGAQFRVNTHTTSTQRYASVAMAPGGEFVVVWEAWENVNTVGRRFDATGSPVGTEFTVGEDTESFRPAVSMAADGGFAVVWETFYYFDVFARRYDSSGQPEGPGFRVNSFSPDIQNRPAVASAPNGAFVVVWNGRDAELSYGVFARRYLAPDLVFADGFE